MTGERKKVVSPSDRLLAPLVSTRIAWQANRDAIPIPPSTAPAQQRTSMSIESHVRLVSPNVRRRSPCEKTLSPLQRRIHSPDRDDQSTPGLRARAARYNYNVQVTTVSPYTPSPPKTACHSPPLSPFPVNVTYTPSGSKIKGGAIQAWGTPTTSPTISPIPEPVSKGVSPRQRFIINKISRSSEDRSFVRETPSHTSPEIFFCYPSPPKAKRQEDGMRTFGEYRRPVGDARSPDSTSFLHRGRSELNSARSESLSAAKTKKYYGGYPQLEIKTQINATSPRSDHVRSPPDTASSCARTLLSESHKSNKKGDLPRWEKHLDELGWNWDTRIEEPAYKPLRPKTVPHPLPQQPSRTKMGAYLSMPDVLKREKTAQTLRLARLVENVKWWHQQMTEEERTTAMSSPNSPLRYETVR